MRTRLLAVVLSVAALVLAIASGCTSPPDVTAPPIGDVTEVRLRSRIDDVGVIRDREAIERLREIVNNNREGWSTPWYGPPIPPQTLAFYNGDNFVGDLGVGDGFVSRRVSQYSRTISADEMNELREIIERHVQRP